MENNNLQVNQNTQKIQTQEQQILNEDQFFGELDQLFDNLQNLIPQKSNAQQIKNLKTLANINEMQNLNEEVLYIENRDIVKDKSEYISFLEQDRMQRIRQKELLIKLGQERLKDTTDGKIYSRGMDEGVLMNSNKKDLHLKSDVEKEETIKSAMKEEEILDITNVAEEFNQEFINNNRTFMSKTLSGETTEKDDTDEEKRKKKDYQIEDDEFLLVKFTDEDKTFISKFNKSLNELEEVANTSQNESKNKHEEPKDYDLMLEIERRINRIGSVIDKKGPKLKPTFKKTKAISNLRKKFTKNLS